MLNKTLILTDYHVHSNFSSDGQAPMEQIIEQAIKLGLKKLCFTDHMDYDYPKEAGGYTFEFDIDLYLKKLSEVKEKYSNRIDILTGVELGLQPHLQDRLKALTDNYPFDFIIGSSHVVDHVDPYYQKYWEIMTEEEGLSRYFQSIIDNCRIYNDFNVYGHIDYIIRYTPANTKLRLEGRSSGTAVKLISYPYQKYADILDEVLKTILSYGRGIEVNTSGYKYGLGHTHPKEEILKRYKELGGEIITIGSDAHRPEHLCYGFDSAAELLKSLGYRYYTTFVKGKPVFEKL